MIFFRFSMSILTIVLAFQSLCFSQVDMKSNVTESQIDSLFSSWEDPAKPGIAVGVVVNGEIQHLRGYGSANLEHNIPITENTKFQYVGMSDQIIAFCVLLLQERGSLDLNDKIRLHLPSLPMSMDDIKLHHLVNHTSGLHDFSVLRQFAGWQATDVFTTEHKEHMISHVNNLEAKSGKKYLSTKMETRLLQDIIETVTELTLNEFATDAIFNPLGMSNSLFTDSAVQLVENRAQGYVELNDEYEIAQIVEDAGQSDLFYTTIEDMSKWAQNLSTLSVGSAALIRQFETFVTVDGAPVDMINSSQYIGQHRYWNFKGTKKLYLIGMQAGYACKLVRFPDQDLSIVVMGNAGSYNGHWSSFVADLYLQKYYVKAEEAVTKQHEAFTLTVGEMENYVGSYWNDDELYSTQVSLDQDTLRYFEEEFNWRMDLIPVRENVFRTSQGHTIKFDIKKRLAQLELIMPSGASSTSIEYQTPRELNQTIEGFVGSYSNKSIGADFKVEKQGGELVLSHLKLGKHTLIPVGKHTFKTNQRLLKQIRFSTNVDGNQQMEITNSTVKHFPFVKDSVKVLE